MRREAESGMGGKAYRNVCRCTFSLVLCFSAQRGKELVSNFWVPHTSGQSALYWWASGVWRIGKARKAQPGNDRAKLPRRLLGRVVHVMYHVTVTKGPLKQPTCYIELSTVRPGSHSANTACSPRRRSLYPLLCTIAPTTADVWSQCICMPHLVTGWLANDNEETVVMCQGIGHD